jgi:hypothetical protein
MTEAGEIESAAVRIRTAARGLERCLRLARYREAGRPRCAYPVRPPNTPAEDPSGAIVGVAGIADLSPTAGPAETKPWQSPRLSVDTPGGRP